MVDLRRFLAWPGAPLGIASAALFGASTPLAKALLGEGVNPWLLAGLLYLGSGLGLAIVHFGRGLIGKPSGEAPLARSDWGWTALVVLAGGLVGPVLLMLGLATTAASGTDGGLFLDGALHRCAAGALPVRRAADVATGRGGGADGRRALPAPRRAPRARP